MNPLQKGAVGVQDESSRSPADPRAEIVAAVAHQLRNRLSRVVFGAERVISSSADPDLVKAATRMRRGIDELVVSFDQLVELARVLSRRAQPRVERVDLAATLAGSLTRARPLFDTRQHTVQVEAPDAPLWVDGDRVGLDVAITNLLTNAAKFTPSGGRVAVRLYADAKTAVLTVADDGIGIEKDRLGRLFDAFEEGTVGLGVGLLLTREVATMHGGTVIARSDGPGRGSEFVLEIPRALKSGAATVARALVVHRDPTISAMLAALARSWGYHVKTAAEAEEAVTEAAEFSPGVVLVEAGLVEQSTMALATRMRRTSGGGSAIFVLLGEADLEAARMAGFDRCVPAPLDPDLIHSSVLVG